VPQSLFLGTHPRFFPLSLSPSFSATIGPILLYRFGSDNVSKVTLPAWCGQGYGCHHLSLGLLGPFVFLSILRCYLLYVWFGSLYCIFGCFDSWSLRGYIIYSFVGSIMNLCNYCYLIPPASRACYDVHEALRGAFPKQHFADCGVIAMIHKVLILGRHKWYQGQVLSIPTGPVCL
jgi:hypothetical protein